MMNLFSNKILKGINEQFDEDEFKSIEDVCVNIYLENAVFIMCFILDEDRDLITFVATDEEGREKVKVANKKYVKSIEICYFDDDFSKKAEKKIDDMFS